MERRVGVMMENGTRYHLGLFLSYSFFSLITFINIFFSGCVSTKTIEIQPIIKLNGSEKIPLHVLLITPKEFCDFSYTHRIALLSGDTDVYPVGHTLCENAKLIIKSSFMKFSYSGQNTDVERQNFQAIITPKILEFDFQRSGLHTMDVKITIEWNVTDGSKKPVLNKTVQGTGKGPIGVSAHRAVQEAVDSVFRASYESFLSSQEIRELVSS